MMRLLIFLAFFPTFLSAQTAFLKDPDVVWAVEVEQDWVVDIPSLESEWDLGITTLKLLRTEQNWVVNIPLMESSVESYEVKFVDMKIGGPALSSPYLADLVYQAALRGKLPVFRDADCRVPMDITNFEFHDTIVTFDPVTYQEKVRAAFSQIDPVDRFKAWRLRQVLIYHKKSATWSTTVQAIAPLIQNRNERGDSIGLRPFFWFRPDGKRHKLTSNQIIWAKQTMNKQLGTQVPSTSKTPVKMIEGFQNPLSHLLRVLKTDMKTPFYSSTGYERPLSTDERISMLVKTDTVVSFNPETYEETVEIKRDEITTDSIHQLRLVQTWYWDDRRHRLSICLDSIAPLVDVLDNLDNLRFQKPLFYRRARR